MDFCVYQISIKNLQHIIFLLLFYLYLPTGVWLHQKMKYCATWIRQSSFNLLIEIVTQALNIIYVRISMLVL
jgi:hypothetical protein